MKPKSYVPFPGDRVQLRKPHPCGSYVWTIVRVGSDVGMICDACGRKVFLERSVLHKRIKRVLATADNTGNPLSDKSIN